MNAKKKTDPREERQQRLAEQLRANLKKRKALARTRRAHEAETDQETPPAIDGPAD